MQQVWPSPASAGSAPVLLKTVHFPQHGLLDNLLKCKLRTTKFTLTKIYFGEFLVMGYFGVHFDFLKFCIDILILMTECFGTL